MSSARPSTRSSTATPTARGSRAPRRTTARAAATAWLTSTSPRRSTISAIQDRTVAVSPVGCSVFLFYYFDVGQHAGRPRPRPAVAHRPQAREPRVDRRLLPGRRRPRVDRPRRDRLDGAARHPDHRHLRQQRDLRHDRRPDGADDPDGPADEHHPDGRDLMQGTPMKVAELIASLDGPVYVERVRALRPEAAQARQERDQEGAHDAGRGPRLRVRGDPRRMSDPLGMTAEDTEKWVAETCSPGLPARRVKDEAARRGWNVRNRRSTTARVLKWWTPGEKAAADLLHEVPRPRRPVDVSSSSRARAETARRPPRCSRPRRHQRGLRRDAHPELRPGVARRDVYADVHVARRRGALPGVALAPRARRLQRAEPRTSSAGPSVPGGTIIYDSSS